MRQVKLIYFEGCPNAEKTKKALHRAGVDFETMCQDELPESHPYKSYSSPTILKENEVVFGSRTGTGSGGCSLDMPSEKVLRESLGDKADLKTASVLSTLSSFGSALTVGLCPICIPAIGSFLSAVGLGFLVSEVVLLPILIGFLLLTVGGLLWSYLKEHRNIYPLVTGILMAVSIYIGRYVYLGATVNAVLMYGGIVGIMAVTIWNLTLRKKAGCSHCVTEWGSK